MIAEVAGRAREASPLWAAALRDEPAGEARYGPRVEPRFALGLETIYEGYLVHHAESRLFRPADRNEAIRAAAAATCSEDSAAARPCAATAR